MFVLEFDAEHGAREHGLDAAFHFNMFFFHGRFVNDTVWENGDIPETGRKGRSQTKNRGPVNPGPEGVQTVRSVTIPTTAAAATVLATTTAAAAGTFLPGLRDVDGEIATVHRFPVEGIDGLLRLFRRAHSNERKAARAAGCPVHHQVGFNDRTVRRKRVLQVVFGGIEGEVPNKQFRAHVMFYCLRLKDCTLLFPDCSRPSGFKSSLNRVHLKIYHASKAASYLSEGVSLPVSEGIATGILNYFKALKRGLPALSAPRFERQLRPLDSLISSQRTRLMNRPAFLTVLPDCLLLAVKLQPRASVNEIMGPQGNELRVRVTAPPVDSAANTALLRLLAETLECPPGRVRLARGHTSRHKVVRLAGIPLATAILKLTAQHA